MMRLLSASRCLVLAVALAACARISRVSPLPAPRCPDVTIGTDDDAHRAALLALRAASAACRTQLVPQLARALGLPVPAFAAYVNDVEGAPTAASLALEAAAVRAHDAAAANAIAAAAIALAHLDQPSAALTTWIPEDAKRAPLVSPDGATWAAVLADRISIRSTATGLQLASISASAWPGGVALLDASHVVVGDREGVRVLGSDGSRRDLIGPCAVRDPCGHVSRALTAGTRGRLAVLDGQTLAIFDAGGHMQGTAPRIDKVGLPRAEWRGELLVILGIGGVELWDTSGAAPLLRATISDQLADNSVAVDWGGSRIALKVRIGDRWPIRVFTRDGKQIAEVGDFGDTAAFVGGALYVYNPLSGELSRLDGNRAIKLADHLGGLIGTLTGARDRVIASDGILIPTATGAQIVARTRPGKAIKALVWAPAGDLLVAAAETDAILLDATGARVIRGGIPMQPPLLFRPHSRELWWAGGHWDLGATGPIAGAPRAELDASTIVAFDAAGAHALGQAGFGRDLELHDVASGARVQTLRIKEPFSVRDDELIAPKRAVFVDSDRLLILDNATSTVVWNVTLKIGVWVTRDNLLAVSHDGTLLVTQSSNGIDGFDLAHERDLGELEIPAGVTAVEFRPDGQQLVVGAQSGKLLIVDPAAWRIVRTVDAHETTVTALAWRPDGRGLATGSSGGTIALWTADLAPLATIAPGTDNVTGIGVSNPFEPNAWIALFPDGRGFGNAAGARYVAARVGTIPLAAGVIAPPAAPADEWAALFR